MNLIELKCKNCGAKMEVNSELNEIHCIYCNTKNIIDDAATELSRIENVKLKARKNYHQQEMQEKKDKDDYKNNKLKHDMKMGLIFFIVSISIIPSIAGINWIFTGYFAMPGYTPNPSLSDYNSITLGMSYEDCKEKLGSEGHLTFEESNKTTYTWYDTNCSDDDCPIIIELEFENNKLVSRTENGLE